MNMSRIANLDAIPIVVGVSGHRDLIEEDIPQIRDEVADTLGQIETLAPNSPLILLSALAEGADQLVVEVALARKRDWLVIAVLPMPKHDFIKDFEGDAHTKFESLLRNCVAVRQLPWAIHTDTDIDELEGITPDQKRRNQQYRNQGIFLARQAQVLIALWDGKPKEAGACGTALAVDTCRVGPPPMDGSILAAPESTGLIHIPVRRRNAPDNQSIPSKPDVTGSQPDSPTLFAQVIREIDTFNSVAKQCSEKHTDKLADGLECLLPSQERDGIDLGSKFVAAQYAEADMLAQVHQRRREWGIKGVSVITIIAALCHATYESLEYPGWFLAYGLAALIAYLVFALLFRLQSGFRVEERFLDYRALAEAARVQVFWRLSGLTTPVAEHYLQLMKTNVGWVQEAARSLGFVAEMLEPKPAERLGVVYEYWIKNQEKYFNEGARRRRDKQSFYDNIAMWLSIIGALLVIVTWVCFMFGVDSIMKAASAYSAGVFLMAGVFKGVSTTMDFTEEAVIFEQTQRVFLNALNYLDNNRPDPGIGGERVRACILELGKYALAENANWLLQHRRNAFKIHGD